MDESTRKRVGEEKRGCKITDGWWYFWSFHDLDHNLTALIDRSTSNMGNLEK